MDREAEMARCHRRLVYSPARPAAAAPSSRTVAGAPPPRGRAAVPGRLCRLSRWI